MADLVALHIFYNKSKLAQKTACVLKHKQRNLDTEGSDVWLKKREGCARYRPGRKPQEYAMQWLITVETERDMIAICRLINVFRRKGLKIVALTMAAQPNSYSTIAVTESPGVGIDHVFNFLRRMEGIRRVVINKKPPVAEKCKGYGIALAPPRL